MLKIVATYRQLTALLLLAAALILPIESVALDLAPVQESCVCHVLPADLPAGDSEEGPRGQHDGGTGDCGAGDCCDSEEHRHDAAETCASCLKLHISANLLFYPNTSNYLPKVYLSIFVPPQS